MNLLATEYSPLHNAFDIYLAGCTSPHCPGCCNPESWNFNQGTACNTTLCKKLQAKINEFDSLIDHVMVMGGEPLDQDVEELEGFLEELTHTRKNVWLFTRYAIKQVPERIKQHCDYIKCGHYDDRQQTEGNTQHGIQLASENQRVYQRGTDYAA